MSKQTIDKLDFSGWPLPDEYLAEVGRITLLWARLEKLLETAVANLAGFNNLSDPRVYIVFTHPGFSQNLALLKELCKHLAPSNPGMRDYQLVIDQLTAAEVSRDRFTSGALGTNQGDGRVEMTVAAESNRFDMITVDVSIADLQQVAVAIDAAQHALYKLVMTLEKPASVWVSD